MSLWAHIEWSFIMSVKESGGKASRDRQMSPGCLILFSVPFAGVGLFMLGWMALCLASYLGMKNWEEVPALIQKAELVSKTSRDSDGKTSTTHEAVATYSYEYRSRKYTSSRVSIYKGSDNLGSFQQQVVRELREHLESGKPFRCFVNPEEPAEAVLYRDLRLEMLGMQALFGLLFGGAGFGIMFFAISSFKRSKEQKLKERDCPQEPWLWRKEWAGGCIPSSSRTGMIFMVAFAIFWNAVSCPILFLLPGEIGGGNQMALIGLIFPVVGLGLAVVALYKVLSWFKYGESYFEMRRLPGFLGGTLEGVIRTKVKIHPEEGFRLSLSCVERVTSGSGKNRRSSERILWQELRTVKHERQERDSKRSIIPVHFTLPGDQPPSSVEASDEKFRWRLEVEAKVPGVDYLANFEVPVFRAKESLGAELRADGEASLADESQPVDLAAELAREGVAMRRSAGLEIHFPMARYKAAGGGMLGFLLLWTGAIVLMLKLGAPLMFPIVFGLFDLLFLYIVLDLLFHSGRIEVRPGSLILSGGLLGIGPTRVLKAEEIADMSPLQVMQSGNTVYYKIRVRTAGGRTMNAGDSIGNRLLVMRLIDEMRKEMGRKGLFRIGASVIAAKPGEGL
ncbi:MAG: DUF3592 domain-containing protein [Planctomycetes bacterium]|nr:DUF3592 domain-containing protein [Planctomycetota bacterium]